MEPYSRSGNPTTLDVTTTQRPRVLIFGEAETPLATITGRLRGALGAPINTSDAAQAGDSWGDAEIAEAGTRPDDGGILLVDLIGQAFSTRALVAEAQRSDAAIMYADAGTGITATQRQHAAILRLAGVANVILAVDCADDVSPDAAVFARLAADFQAWAARLGIVHVAVIPISAATGANIVDCTCNITWYEGPTVLGALASVSREDAGASHALRMPIGMSPVPGSRRGGHSGTITSGTLASGEKVCVMPAGLDTQVVSILDASGPIDRARAGDAVTIVLADEVEAGRGSVVVAASDRPELADQFAADIIWFGDHPLLAGRTYGLTLGPQSAIAQISDIRYVVSVITLEHVAVRTVERNAIARCNLSLSQPLVIEPFESRSGLGAFEITDRETAEVVGAGMIAFALRRAQNIHWQAISITSRHRSEIKSQRGCCLWLTGLSGSGKSTLANALETQLHALGRHTMILDGDNVRHGLCRDLGFTEADRVENIRRVTEVARLMVDAGLITIVSFISPFRSERRLARERFEPGEFVEVFVDAPLEVCEARDPKGLYRKARSGDLQNFTGISSPYEPPENPDIKVETHVTDPDALVAAMIDELRRRAVLPS